MSSRRRIVIHTSEPSLGAARYVCEFVKGLAATDASVLLFCPSNFEHLHELEAYGVEVFLAGKRGVQPCGLARRILRNLRFFVQTAWRQLRITKAGDLIHFQFPLYFPLGLSFFLLATLKSCPIVFTAHDPLPHKWLWPARFRSFERKMLEWGYRLSRLIIVHNETGRQTLIREFGVKPEKVSVIAHGPFPLPSCTPTLPRFSELRLLVFGSIRENKGIHLAIEAVQLLIASGGPPVHLTIAGSVANAREESYWNRCKSLIEKQPDGICVIEGAVPDADVGALLGDHHVLLLPYIDFSSESGVASLALSNRRPILATRVGGLGTLLASSHCGIPIESATVEGVAAAIAMAREGGLEMLDHLAAEGQAFVSSARSWRQISIETVAEYSQLTGTGRSVPTIYQERRENC